MVGDERARLVRSAATGWADELIDLDRRNRLLCYRDFKTTTLDLGSADPEAVAKLLAGEAVRLSVLFGDPDRHADARDRARAIRRRIRVLAEEQGLLAGYLVHGLVGGALPASASADRGGQAAGALALRAPLLLYRVEIVSRGAAEIELTVQISGPTGEPELNPVLCYALARHAGADVDALSRAAELAAGEGSPEELLQQTFAAVARCAADSGLPLELEDRLVVGVFSYEKLAMVEDLRSAGELLARHDVIAALAGDAGAQRALAQARDAQVVDILPAGSVDELPPHEEYLVHSADSSQQRVVRAVLGGRSVVVQGPPGTGKSQTIANLIAELAARGKTALFVAEKRAALDAVIDRLAQADLGGLVLDLHDGAGSRRKVAEQLAESLTRAGQEAPLSEADARLHDHLADRRARAARHRAEMTVLRVPWGVSAAQAQRRAFELQAQHSFDYRFPPEVLAELAPAVGAVREDVAEFVAAGGLAALRGNTSWARCPAAGQDDVRTILDLLTGLTSGRLHELRRRLQTVLAATGFTAPPTLAGWRGVLELLAGVARSVELFGDRVFGPDLDGWVAATASRGWRRQHDQAQLGWTQLGWTQLGWTQLGWTQLGWTQLGWTQLGWTQRRALRRDVRAARSDGVHALPALHTDLLHAIAQRAAWYARSGGATLPEPVAGLAATTADYDAVLDDLDAVAAWAGHPDLPHRAAAELDRTLRELLAERDTLFRMPRVNELRGRLAADGLSGFLTALAGRHARPGDAAELFDLAWFASVHDELKLSVSHIGTFDGDGHGRIVQEYQQADRAHIELAARRVRRAVAERMIAVRNAHPAENQLVREQAKRKRGHRPIRRLLTEAPHVLLAARPCWAMSPLVVSKMLPADQLFDVVIFDEASQIEPAHAIASIMRGRQVVAAGDSKQLPPTVFFRSILRGQESDEDSMSNYDSVLDRLDPLLPSAMLSWHYRSLDERLIAFSNDKIYQRGLVTFPGVLGADAITHVRVDGRTEPGAEESVPQEVQRVAQLVLAHARTRPQESLGVIALGIKHAERISAALRTELAELDADSEVADFFADDQPPDRRFFVKNLETVQGDERDAIILSVGYGRSAAGGMRYNFGPINQRDGYRRLNVAVTRARRRMTVISSFSHWEMDPDALHSEGARLLRLYLEFAASNGRQHGGGPPNANGGGPPHGNGVDPGIGIEPTPFEASVLEKLRANGVPAHPRYGMSGHRIDFALEHPDQPGRMVLAVEVDGDAYHRLPTVRERDRLRQEHLERLGWRYHRLWSADWYRDEHEQTRRIVRAWRLAIAATDEPEPGSHGSGERAEPAQLPSAPTPALGRRAGAPLPRRGPPPPVPADLTINDYSHEQLVTVVRYLLSDGLLRDDAELLDEARDYLGFRRRGPRIVERLSAAIHDARVTP